MWPVRCLEPEYQVVLEPMTEPPIVHIQARGMLNRFAKALTQSLYLFTTGFARDVAKPF